MSRRNDELKRQLNELYAMVADVAIRVKDIQDDLQDVKARTHDTQDRSYDALSMVEQLECKVRGAIDVPQKLFFYNRAESLEMDYNETRRQWFRDIPKADGILRLMQLLDLQLLKSFDEICRNNEIPYWIDFGTLLGAVRHGGFIPWDDDIDVSMMREDVERLRMALEGNDEYYLLDLYVHVKSDSVNHSCQFKCIESKYYHIPCGIDVFIYDSCDDASENGIAYKTITSKKNDYVRVAWEHWSKQGIRDVDDIKPESQQIMRALFDQYLSEVFESDCLNSEGSSMIWAFDNAPQVYTFQSNCRKDAVFPLVDIEFEGARFLAPRETERRLEEKYGDYLALPHDISSHAHYAVREYDWDVLLMLARRYGIEPPPRSIIKS